MNNLDDWCLYYMGRIVIEFDTEIWHLFLTEDNSMAGDTCKKEQSDEARTRELLEFHKRIKRRTDLLKKVASDMDEVDLVYKIWEWVERAGVSGGDRLQKLTELLSSFRESLFHHFAGEEKHMVPYLDRHGATEFSSRLAKQHKAIEDGFDALDRKIAALTAMTADTRKVKELETEIKEDLEKLLKGVERHALEEEDTFFMLTHNI